MTVGTVSLFYALLALAANAFVLVVVGLAVSGRLHLIRSAVAPIALPAAFTVAVLATAGSLYFSEVAHFEPCRLCWYQRIAMYPLVVILAVAGWRRDAGIWRYVVAIAGVGILTSGYHDVLEWLPWLIPVHARPMSRCTLVWFRQLGFISLPYLALSAFALIISLVWLGRRPSVESNREAPDQGPGRRLAVADIAPIPRPLCERTALPTLACRGSDHRHLARVRVGGCRSCWSSVRWWSASQRSRRWS